MIKLGYSLGGSNPKYSIKERIKILSSVEKHAIEVSYIIASNLEVELDREDIKAIKKFRYISIHAPVLASEGQNTGEKIWLRYPSKNSDAIIEQLLMIAKKIGAEAILFHPDLVDDFKWLNQKIGSLLSFENMDKEKPFGNTVRDLENVFTDAPSAKWVCDLNHIFTIDRTMAISRDFHEAFKDRLCHYHLSAYGGFHDCFYISGEDVIFQGIKDFSVPIIHEGRALREGRDSLIKENKYVLEKLKKY